MSILFAKHAKHASLASSTSLASLAKHASTGFAAGEIRVFGEA